MAIAVGSELVTHIPACGPQGRLLEETHYGPLWSLHKMSLCQGFEMNGTVWVPNTGVTELLMTKTW